MMFLYAYHSLSQQKQWLKAPLPHLRVIAKIFFASVYELLMVIRQNKHNMTSSATFRYIPVCFKYILVCCKVKYQNKVKLKLQQSSCICSVL